VKHPRWHRTFRLPWPTPERDVDEELAFHFGERTEALIASGLTEAAATRQAEAEFGNRDSIRRTLVEINERAARRFRRGTQIEQLRQDVHLAFRLFRRSPAFFVAAVLTLAIGIGANGAVFSILRSTLLQPLPYRNPDELVLLRPTPANGVPWESVRLAGPLPLTAQTILGWHRNGTERIGEFAALMIHNVPNQFDLDVGDGMTRLAGGLVTPNFFTLLGAHAARGRLFSNADEATAEALIVLSDALWRRDFHGDPSIVGRSITLAMGDPRERRTLTVAGILPPSFHFTYPDETEAWVLMRWSDVAQYNPQLLGFSAIARLRPGLPLAEARRRAAEEELPIAEEKARDRSADRLVVGLVPMHDWVIGDTRASLELLGAVAALLLLITCITVSNGLLARVSERQQELAVRATLGAGRGRLVRQLLTEGALLSIGGAVAGTMLAVALQPVLRSLLPPSIPRVGEIAVNGGIVAFGAAMATVTTVLAAVVPAWGGTRSDAARLLAGASAASSSRSALRWRHGLVGAQAAIATALLISASLLLTSFWELGRVPLGFDGRKVLTVELRLLDTKYALPGAKARFEDELVTRVRAIPGIADVGITSAVPFRVGDRLVQIHRPGGEKMDFVRERRVDPGYFRALHVAPIRGRLLDYTDRDVTTPVTVISESYARLAFGGDDPVGQKVGAREVVGVVADLRYASLEQDPTPSIYVPEAQAQQAGMVFSIVARAEASASAVSLVPAIRRVIRDIDPALPAMNFTTVDQLVDASVANRRFYTVATVSFATIALLLTVVGLIVIVARVVTERRRELAIRAALGATMSTLARVATRDALIAVGVGVAIGVAGAYAGSAVFAQFLFHVAPRSPTAYSSVALLVLGVATLAAWGPIRRFDRVSLAILLRRE
jgi:predicted permease